MDKIIAYFCLEYALDPNLPIYAGGLGILAGDYMREANDQKIPVVGVGLFYNFENHYKLELVLDKSGKPLIINVPIQDKQIKVQIFKYLVGSIPIYLLNTNLQENEPDDQLITNKIYVGDKETRLKQEMILGIGGQRALEAMDINPVIYHLNEGHSAFLALELIRHEIQTNQISFDEAIALAKKKMVFTNHTLVTAGREIFSDELITLELGGYVQELGVPISEVVKLGQVRESSVFSMTNFSLEMAGKVNAVSKLHALKAVGIWPDYPMLPVTNGIHIKTWDKVKDIKNHQMCKQELLDYIYEQTGIRWETNQLLLGWARRFVEYKRPLAILDDLDRFISIAENSQSPVKIVFAGVTHENDIQGKELILKLQNLIKNKIGDVAVYLPKYSLQNAQKLVAGCDVWLNTPIVGFEACGTSGMKAALNGVLPCSTQDGWVDEAEMYKVGWVIDSDHITRNILDILEHNIVPMYYQNQPEWQAHMQNARNMIINQFSTTRMLKEYFEKLYPNIF